MIKKRIPVFYIVLAIVIVITLIGTEIGKGYLKDVLADYEDSQYKHVAEEFFNSNFVFGDAEALATLFNAQIPRFETEESFARYLSEITTGKEFVLQNTSSGLNEEKTYSVVCDNVKFATFSIVKSGETSEYGFDLYRPSSIVFNENLFEPHYIYIPSGYLLKLNGFDVDISYSVGNRIPTASGEFMPDGVAGITYTTFLFDKLCGTPEFEVFSPNGEKSNISENDNGSYRAEIVYNAKLAEEFSDYVIEATKAYACYMQKDATFSKIGKYMDPSSEIYKNIKTSPNWMVIDHKGYDFENEQATEFYAYSDDVFSCRVSLVHILKYPKLEDFRDTIDMTWYLRKVNGKYLIYNSYTN